MPSSKDISNTYICYIFYFSNLYYLILWINNMKVKFKILYYIYFSCHSENLSYYYGSGIWRDLKNLVQTSKFTINPRKSEKWDAKLKHKRIHQLYKYIFVLISKDKLWCDILYICFLLYDIVYLVSLFSLFSFLYDIVYLVSFIKQYIFALYK